MLRGTRTLRAMTEILEQALDGRAPTPSVPPAEDGPSGAADDEPPVQGVTNPGGVARPEAVPAPRHTVSTAEVPVPRQKFVDSALEPAHESWMVPPEGVFIVTDDGRGVAPAVVDRLERRGARGVLLRLPEARAGGPGNEIGARIDEVRSRSGPLRGLIHLHPLATGVAGTTVTRPEDQVVAEVA